LGSKEEGVERGKEVKFTDKSIAGSGHPTHQGACRKGAQPLSAVPVWVFATSGLR
jgi:hypothetical protein